MHIGIIPDGNRRWAKYNDTSLESLPGIWFQYIIDVLKEYINNKDLYEKLEEVTELSIYICSIDNMNRNDCTYKSILKFIDMCIDCYNMSKHTMYEYLMSIKAIDETLDYDSVYEFLHSLDVKINIVGDKEMIPEKIRNIGTGSKNAKYIVNLALIYDYAKDLKNFGVEDNDDYNREQSNIDLVIRSGGEQRISGFFPTKILYSELIFIDKLWPDIRLTDILDSINEYEKRDKRNGL